MPPSAPSPYRFLKPKQQRASSPVKAKTSTSNLRHEAHERVDQDLLPPQKDARSSQFARAPRFMPSSTQSTRKRSPRQVPVQAFQPSGKQREDVQETGGDEDGTEMLLDNETDVITTTELQSQWEQELPHSPKRRRIQIESEHAFTEAEGTPQRAIGPKDPPTRSTPRFRPSELSHASPGATVGTASALRPAFLRPAAPAEQTPAEPLPEAFSPHRRGHKFVPGGMAATLQQWVLETGQAAAQSRRGHGYLKGEDFVLKVRVEQVGGNGMRLVQGRDAGGEEVRLLLAEHERSGRTLEDGVVVGVRAPVWEVDVAGQSWTVGADWRILG